MITIVFTPKNIIWKSQWLITFKSDYYLNA